INKKSSNAILSFLDASRRLNAGDLKIVDEHLDELSLEDIPELILLLEKQMKEAAKKMEFEEAAKLRDRIKYLRDKMLGR
ncbi:MAG: UvrB/UvrC motif-containing protein, partial [Dolichospermum sp.]